ncbi:MAG: hypothetical protein QOJ63_2530 [Solirubrobacteraceae bacterium]|jgi:hypothetical protein|nr:hypothetical protein [Solirubrobacteraceae bacterium]
MTPPAWERRLAFAVAMHDTIVAGDHMLGRASTEYPAARQRVVYLIDEALAAGVPEATIDEALARFRAEARVTPLG